VIVSIVSAVALYNSLRIATLESDAAKVLRLANAREDQAIVLIRHTDYRLCYRSMVTRAAINLDKTNDELRLPLYDCTPNLDGGAAIRMTPAQTAKFLRYVKSAKNLL
jgi:hypothetical protein